MKFTLTILHKYSKLVLSHCKFGGIFLAKTVVVTGGVSGIARAIALRFARGGVSVVLNYQTQDPEELCDEIMALGASCMPFMADVNDAEQAEALINMTKEVFGSADYFVNFGSNIDTVKCAVAVMKEQQYGAIVNVSDAAGLADFTKAMAKELGKDGITVNAVVPGFIETALKNWPEEVADLVYFVANCKYMTAQAITIDGGQG